jgi:hypothetical protein
MPFGNYYWRVNVDLGSGFAPSPVFRTMTITPPRPLAPTLIAPANNATASSNTPTFSWNAVSATTAGGPFSYEIQIDNNSTMGSPTMDVTGAAGVLNYTAGPLTTGVYYWRVRAVNSLGVPGTWSSIRSFRSP